MIQLQMLTFYDEFRIAELSDNLYQRFIILSEGTDDNTVGCDNVFVQDNYSTCIAKTFVLLEDNNKEHFEPKCTENVTIGKKSICDVQIIGEKL